MTTYSIVSDFHLGTKRAAHTTRESAAKLQEELFNSAMSATVWDNTLCLGDMFDRARNDETTLLQGYEVAKQCSMVISGNHENLGRMGVTTTLHALAEIFEDGKIVEAYDLSTPHYDVVDNTFWVVPHHGSQEVFEKALMEAADDAGGSDVAPHRYLLLHTNYNVPFDTEDSTLNLTPEMAERLLEVFDRVFTGHEHNPKELMGGRLVIVGNTHPSSFSDISTKYRWTLDAETDELSKTVIWDADKRHKEIVYGEAIEDLTGVQFVDVIGNEPVDNGVEVAEYVRSVWGQGDDLLAVRNNVIIKDHLADFESEDSSKPALVDLKQRIHDDLEGSDLQETYTRLLGTVEQ